MSLGDRWRARAPADEPPGPPKDDAIRAVERMVWLTPVWSAASVALLAVASDVSALLLAAFGVALVATQLPVFVWLRSRMHLMRRAWEKATAQGLYQEDVIAAGWARRVETDSTFSTFALLARTGLWLQPRGDAPVAFVPRNEISAMSERKHDLEITHGADSIRLRLTGESFSPAEVQSVIGTDTASDKERN